MRAPLLQLAAIAALSWAVLSPRAEAAPGRLHLLTPALTKRLAAPARANAGAVIRYGDGAGKGSGAIVAFAPTPGGRSRALVLTNHHVAGEAFRVGERIQLLSGARGRAVRLVSSAERLDYALVEVELSPGARPTPLTLRAAPIGAGERLYAVSAFTNVAFAQPPLALGGGPRAHGRAAASVRKGRTNLPTIALGTVQGDGQPIEVVTRWPTLGTQSDLPNASGMSGSPVFARDTHEMVGLHFSGLSNPGAWVASAAPTHLILQDLAARRAELPAGDLVDQLLARAGAPR